MNKKRKKILIIIISIIVILGGCLIVFLTERTFKGHSEINYNEQTTIDITNKNELPKVDPKQLYSETTGNDPEKLNLISSSQILYKFYLDTKFNLEDLSKNDKTNYILELFTFENDEEIEIPLDEFAQKYELVFGKYSYKNNDFISNNYGFCKVVSSKFVCDNKSVFKEDTNFIFTKYDGSKIYNNKLYIYENILFYDKDKNILSNFAESVNIDDLDSYKESLDLSEDLPEFESYEKFTRFEYEFSLKDGQYNLDLVRLSK